MTIAAPEPGTVDWETICRVDAEALALRANGSLDVATFERLWHEAAGACPDDHGPLETLRMIAPLGWKPPQADSVVSRSG